MEPSSTAFPGQQQGPSTPTGRPVRRSKQSVAEAFLARLHERGDIDLGAPGFVESVCAHFERLPTRYALDVNIESLDVLSHKRLLEEARSDPATVSFAVRSVEVLHTRHSSDSLPTPAFPAEVRPLVDVRVAIGLAEMGHARSSDRGAVIRVCTARPSRLSVFDAAAVAAAASADPTCHTSPVSLNSPPLPCPIIPARPSQPSPRRGQPVPPSSRQRPLPKPAFGSSPNLQVRVGPILE